MKIKAWNMKVFKKENLNNTTGRYEVDIEDLKITVAPHGLFRIAIFINKTYVTLEISSDELDKIRLVASNISLFGVSVIKDSKLIDGDLS